MLPQHEGRHFRVTGKDAALKIFNQLVEIADTSFHAAERRRGGNRASFGGADRVTRGAKALRQIMSELAETLRGDRRDRSQR